MSAEILRGAPVAAALNKRTERLVSDMAGRGIVPTLAILRAGENADDVSYEKGAVKRCAALGIRTVSAALPADVGEGEYLEALRRLNEDDGIHGILMLRPLPEQIDEKKARELLCPEKDVDGCTNSSLAMVFTGRGSGFAPCTARAVMEMLDYYGVETAGRRACVLGRSLVVGRPLAMLLTAADATVTLCHSKTGDTAAAVREADILVACSGQMESVGRDFMRPGQTVIDVGINWNEEKGKLCGDVRYDEAAETVKAISPVPGGVGAVTTAVLALQVAEAAARGERR